MVSSGDPGFLNPDCSDVDNCPLIANPGQEDTDSGGADGFGDVCDNCPYDSNPGQENADDDDFGDLCDTCTDTDGDSHGNPDFPFNICPDDNCPDEPNPGQVDFDSDLVGDDCDNCWEAYNPGQEDGDGDEVGDVCDNCEYGYNPEQGIATFPPNVLARKYCSDDYSACSTDEDCSGLDCRKGLFEWSASAWYFYVLGDFIESEDIGSYSYSETNHPISDQDTFFPASADPPPGEGRWYLFKPDCPGLDSWQTVLDAEPLRDTACP